MSEQSPTTPSECTDGPEQAIRLAAVHRYEILDAPPDGTFDDVARAAALIFGTPIATVSIVDADRVWFAATHGLEGSHRSGPRRDCAPRRS